MVAKHESRQLKEIFTDSKEAVLNTFYDRMITIPVSSITALKQELAATVGIERAKGVFVRYGWHSGVSDGGKALTFRWEDELELINIGPKLHMLHGYLDKVIIKDIDYDQAGKLSAINLTWHHSFEAEEYLKHHPPSEETVCHILCGYASGYLSTVLKRTILVKEISCRANGGDYCEVICIPADQEREELDSEYHYYQSTSMIEELDEMTANYKQERDDLNETYHIHQQLMAELLSKKGIQGIVETLYEETGLPVFVDNEDGQIIGQSLDVNLDFDFKTLQPKKTTFIEVTPDIRLLRTPILFEQQIKGYCTFIFPKDELPNELTKMIIEQASLTASIVLLNENIKINTELNIRRGYLNNVLEGKLDKEELYKVARFLHFDPHDAYWMMTIERTEQLEDKRETIKLSEKLVQAVQHFFKERRINVISSQKSGRIVVLIERTSFEMAAIKQAPLINQLLKQLRRQFKRKDFAIGVSSMVQQIDKIAFIYEEALAALKAKNAVDAIFYYEDLGIESMLFQIPDNALINRFIEKQIGDLLKVDKDFELIKTFYAYVENGININHTAKAISMSISGLRYRLARISEILDLDFDDTKSVFSVYMALNVLKVKGEISI